MGNGGNPTCPAWNRERLLRAIGMLLKRLNASDEELFRGLLLLAWDWEVEPEQFRLLLIEARLARSRASELKDVLAGVTICEKFLTKGPDGKYEKSWAQALAEARLSKPNALDKAVAKLMRAILINGRHWTMTTPENGWSLARDEHSQLRFKSDHDRLEILFKYRPVNETENHSLT